MRTWTTTASTTRRLAAITLGVLATLAAPALADDAAAGDDTQRTAPPTPRSELPPARSDTDPAPPVARPDLKLPPGYIVEQAGVGGDVGYGRAGVLELGGSAGLMLAPSFRNVNVAPSIGWFVADNLELSAILGVSHIKAGDESATVFSAVVEPSYHLPFNRTLFGFAGLGVGGAYISKSGLGGGFAVAPRIGANFLVGRSGVLTPSLSYEYTTHSIESDQDDRVALLAVSSSLRVNIGYTAMW